MQLFHNLNEEGLTIIMVTHDQQLASRTQKIHVMDDGKLQKPNNNRENEKTTEKRENRRGTRNLHSLKENAEY